MGPLAANRKMEETGMTFEEYKAEKLKAPDVYAEYKMLEQQADLARILFAIGRALYKSSDNLPRVPSRILKRTAKAMVKYGVMQIFNKD